MSSIETSPREGDVLGEQLGTRDDAWLAERRQSHRLRRVELRILKCGQTYDAVDQRWRELRPIDVDLIAKHDLDRFGHRALDRLLLVAAGRGAAQGSSSSSVEGRRTPKICPAVAASVDQIDSISLRDNPRMAR